MIVRGVPVGMMKFQIRAMSPFLALQELVSYRSLLYNLVTKDLKVRYKNSALGFLWSLLNPLLMMTVYTVVFTKILPSTISHFEVYVLSGLLPWNWCARSLPACATSLVDNSAIIGKVYFPRVLLPVAVVLAEATHFLLALPSLFLLMLIFQVPFTPWIAYLPILFLIQAVLLVGLGLFLAALNAIVRDVGVILEALLLAWFFLTPIFYDIRQAYPDAAGWVYRANPMASIVTQYHTILIDHAAPSLLFDIRAGITAAVVFLLGYSFFMAQNRTIGEYL